MIENESAASGLTYYQNRLKALGITEDQNLYNVKFTNVEAEGYCPVFIEKDNGDIAIIYGGLNALQTFGKNRNGYVRFNLHPERQKEGQQYQVPKGAGTQIFIPPAVIQQYQARQEIPTLVITEGEFNAFKAAMHNIPCIGLQSPQGFTSRSESGKILNPELETLIIECKVKNLVFLFNQDCLSINYEPDTDLYKKPFQYYSAVKSMQELTKPLKCDLYFSHLKADIAGPGIENLLSANVAANNEIAEALMSLQTSAYFHVQKIAANSLKRLLDYFSIGSVESFYGAYDEVLQQKPFIYNGGRYEFTGYRLDLLKIPEAFDFLRIGDDYFKKVMKPNRMGDLEPDIKPVKKTTILDDHKKKASNILDMIDKYEGFTNVPGHLNHREVINGWFNIYMPLPSRPQEGECRQSLEFARHIFGEQYEMGLDYMQLLFQRPTQFLPVLCLVSNENNTGKSTFPKWLRVLFGQNVTQCNNTELDSEFNDNYASKLVIYIDETFIEKRIIKERIKNLSTSDKITMNAKNKAKQEIEFFGKFILCSNNEDNFVNIDEEDIRFWVRKIKKPETDNVNLLEELTAEASAFLYFLSQRKLHFSEKKTRMWFPVNALETEALQNVREASRSQLEKAIRAILRDKFLECKVTELNLTKKLIYEDIKANGISNYNTFQVEECLKKKFNLLPGTNRNFEYPEVVNRADAAFNDVLEVVYKKTKGMPYTFRAEDFLNQEERAMIL